ncbi:peptidyl-tRNA hydrolase [Protomyces lactucae-debilis]|uniref:Peptidyl-tRNA hydrolase n=1 Tax=Protomyces lactucae-debilis TaxID=2754530 RepID=A0A1Y2F0D7_PROLT|nr:peptidyl-tRNA hydrolase [Protomyces lactucae-debilis]ORY77348.1 peptidyl-tRNA hydrolase [Protomyces lactucae-debilis]
MRCPAPVRRSDLQGRLSNDNNALWLFHSDVDMNLSGNAVAKAFRLFQQHQPTGLLCVLHDEMEMKLGTAKLRLKGQARGHNGIRSCIQRLATPEFARIGIGIDRPASRDSAAVTSHVLGKFTTSEMRVLKEETLPALLAAIEQLSFLQET